MKNINNIDELLKNSFQGFEATPPANVWSGIQQGISNTPTIHSQSSVSHVATVVKSASIITKVVIAAVTSGVVLGGSFIAYKYFNKTEIVQTKNVVQQIQSPKNIEQKVDEKLPEQNQKSFNQKSKISLPPTQTETKKVDNISDEKLIQSVSDNGNKPEVINSTNTPSNQNQKVVQQVQKTEQKPVLPKPKHPSAPAENTNSSTTNTDENNFVKPNIPNYLTPNGDGINDKFEIEIENEIYYSLKIYDSQNNLVFESNNKENMWDGTKMNSGELCDVGDYIFVFNYKYKNSEKVIPAKGFIKLIR